MSHVDQRREMREPEKLFPPGEGTGPDPAAMDNAAEALREAEVQSVDPDPRDPTGVELEAMNIDELRIVAKELDIPDRETITEKSELLAAIRRHL